MPCQVKLRTVRCRSPAAGPGYGRAPSGAVLCTPAADTHCEPGDSPDAVSASGVLLGQREEAIDIAVDAGWKRQLLAARRATRSFRALLVAACLGMYAG